MTIQQAYQQLLLQLYEIYDNREAANIADLVIEHVTGFKKIDRIINKTFPLNAEQQEQFEGIGKQLVQQKPIQYILGEAWFYGMKLFVDDNVLIPRPETEELVEWVVHLNLKNQNNNLSVLDIGTGSGCIAIAIKKKLPLAEISAIDLSASALSVAKRNASEQDLVIDFQQADFLKENEWEKLNRFNVIVSNPPYIKQSEEVAMNNNVLEYEPHLALFVPDSDALIFYRKIAEFSEKHLKENGTIFLEINEALGEEVSKVFKDNGYRSVEIRKDMQGKDRMVKVRK